MSGIWSLGFDVSTIGTGVILLDPDGKHVAGWAWQDNNINPDHRLRSLHLWTQYIIRLVNRVDAESISLAMEAPFVRGPGTAQLIRVQGAVMAAFDQKFVERYGIDRWALYPPRQVKATAGRVTKLPSVSKADLGVALEAADPDAHAAISEGALGWADKAKAFGDLVDAYWVARTDFENIRATIGGSDGKTAR